ncbi:hypothetical protein [Paenibacillus pinihumi]|uniref:hypothetical protein n=1 Tax=Paenibacillus pinihumi TaxID=669462 RepID=UPI0004091F8E|nr:hypothetical protein [Paenibacillus pinihumi]
MKSVSKAMHRIRYVLIDGIIRATLIDTLSRTTFVAQPPFFHAVTGVSPNKTLGTTRVNDMQLASLTGVFTYKEVSDYDRAHVSVS